MTFYSTKTFGNDRGLSCCFRQWKSTHSHCSQLHGYSIGAKFIFTAETLDERNWVYDFGGFKEIKQWLEYMFDHTLLVAQDDPHLDKFKELEAVGGVVNLRVVPAVGCERFAEMVYNYTADFLDKNRSTLLNPTVKLKSVEIFEHGANSAIFEKQ